MTGNLELRLHGGAPPDGQIELGDLAAISAALQELTRRLARLSVEAAPVGRPSSLVAELSEMRLSGIEVGSTVLRIQRGTAGALDVALPESDDVDSRLHDVLYAMNENRRPSWSTAPVSATTRKLAIALKAAADIAQFQISDLPVVRVHTRSINPDTWASDGVTVTEHVVVSGELEAVDLKSRRFRIRDALHQAIHLEDLEDAASAAQLIGSRVQAEGVAVRDQDGRILVVKRPLLTAAPLPESWTQRVSSDVAEILRSPGPTFDDGIELDDEEYADLISYLRA